MHDSCISVSEAWKLAGNLSSLLSLTSKQWFKIGFLRCLIYCDNIVLIAMQLPCMPVVFSCMSCFLMNWPWNNDNCVGHTWVVTTFQNTSVSNWSYQLPTGFSARALFTNDLPKAISSSTETTCTTDGSIADDAIYVCTSHINSIEHELALSSTSLSV